MVNELRLLYRPVTFIVFHRQWQHIASASVNAKIEKKIFRFLVVLALRLPLDSFFFLFPVVKGTDRTEFFEFPKIIINFHTSSTVEIAFNCIFLI